MKCFIKGLFGASVGYFLISFCAAQYSDYRATAEVSVWLLAILPTQDAIASMASKQGNLRSLSQRILQPTFPANDVSTFKISEAGEITIKGGRDGQVIILTPSFSNGKVRWDCLGGPNKAVPFACKK